MTRRVSAGVAQGEGSRLSLHGKVALVTGAGGEHSIGRSIASMLARNGADVVVTDVTVTPKSIPRGEDGPTSGTQWQGLESVRAEIEAIGRKSVSIVCDLADEVQVTATFEAAIDQLGHLDILVNNARASLGADLVSIADLDVAEWDRVMSVNMRGAFLACKSALPSMKSSGRGGRIINIASVAGRKGAAGMAAYSASKFGLIGLTQALAMEVAGDGITVNAVCPGAIGTARFSEAEWAKAQEEGIPYDEYRARRLAVRGTMIPVGRVGTASEVASAVLYLASPEAAFVTGQALDVNGGEWMG